MSAVTATEEWVLGPEDTPFYTKTWAPAEGKPKAYIIFVHGESLFRVIYPFCQTQLTQILYDHTAGFAEHIARYNTFFTTLASPPSSLHITAFDQRGHGRTAFAPLTDASPEVVAWKKEGKRVKIEKNGKRRTGGWGKVFWDMEFFVRREGERARREGGKLFLWGFSMGGGQVLAFATRPHLPPARDTLNMLSGVISGGPLIRQTKPAPAYQMKAGTFVAGLGLGNFLIPTPIVCDDLSHNDAVNQANANDPFCEQVGSLRGVADMLNGGITLDTPATWEAWPENLPLLVYIGGEDKLCDPKAAVRFGENAKAKEKKVKVFEGMYHEVHNELEPTPTELATTVTEWINARLGEGEAGAAVAAAKL